VPTARLKNLLRQYFPKGTDISGFSQAKLSAVARQLNERPRKTLQYQTPAEKFGPVLRPPVEITPKPAAPTKREYFAKMPHLDLIYSRLNATLSGKPGAIQCLGWRTPAEVFRDELMKLR
jgi:IS30 family transposase